MVACAPLKYFRGGHHISVLWPFDVFFICKPNSVQIRQGKCFLKKGTFPVSLDPLCQKVCACTLLCVLFS